MTGNKKELISRIYAFLLLSNSVVKIQKIIRGCLQRKYTKYHGPALKNRLLCTNNFDFLSMEQLTEIPKEQFFSFKDGDGFIYGFDILSLHNLIVKNGKTTIRVIDKRKFRTQTTIRVIKKGNFNTQKSNQNLIQLLNKKQ